MPLRVVELANDLLVQRLRWQHLGRIEDLIHERFRTAIKLIHLQDVGWRIIVSVQVDLEALHVLNLVIRLYDVGGFGTTARNLLPAVALEDVERESVVAVEKVRAVLPNELCRDAVGLSGIRVVEVQCLFPVSIVGETVRLTGSGRVDERIVDWIVEVEPCQDMARPGTPCALQ